MVVSVYLTDGSTFLEISHSTQVPVFWAMLSSPTRLSLQLYLHVQYTYEGFLPLREMLLRVTKGGGGMIFQVVGLRMKVKFCYVLQQDHSMADYTIVGPASRIPLSRSWGGLRNLQYFTQQTFIEPGLLLRVRNL